MSIVVFGTVFMDIKGFPQNAYDPVGRNVGEVKFIHGGVGRNVAENLGILGVAARLAGTVDDSGVGGEIIDRLRRCGVDTADLRPVRSGGMGMWMAILDQNGDLAGSISQMPDLGLFEALIEERGEAIIREASHVALEIDLNEAIARRVIAIANRLGRPVYALPGNLEVTRRSVDLLPRLECFICNDIEAQKIMAEYFDTADIGDLRAKVRAFAERIGMKSIIVTLGEKGAVYWSVGQEARYAPVRPVKMVDSTGAGDAFFSGVAAALADGRSLAEAVDFGARVAAHTIQSAESTCVGFMA